MPEQPNPRQTTGASAAGKRSASAGTPVVVALIVLLCIGAIFYLALRDDGTDQSSAPPASQPTVSYGYVDCTAPPTAPQQAQTFKSPPEPSLAEGAVWDATVETNCGNIALELYGDKAPQTVASFIFLAQQDYWVDSPCHRLTTAGIFVLQCGDPTGSGSGGPGYGFGIENAPANGRYPPGTLAMARTADPNSNGSQFFVVYDDTTLPVDGGGYSIFGRVTDGLDIVETIAEKGVSGGGQDGAPAQPLSILGVTVQKR
ncbi:MAG: peptidylprolyl isomerase [Propionibacteriales bacterium]|nr:peptidylprolyl isomerase [Propionibacteriales bacterium]